MNQLDDLDYQILKVLMKDGQTTNIELSRMTGTSVNTIRNRIQRMLDMGALKIIGVTHPQMLGFDIHAVLGIDVYFPHREAVAEGFTKMKSVRYVAHAVGPHDVYAIAFFRSMEHYYNWMQNEVSQIEGIKGIQTMFITQEVKRTYDYVSQIEDFLQK